MSKERLVSVKVRWTDYAAIKAMAMRNHRGIVGQIEALVEEKLAFDKRAGWRPTSAEDVGAMASARLEDVGAIEASAPEDFGPDGVGAPRGSGRGFLCG